MKHLLLTGCIALAACGDSAPEANNGSAADSVAAAAARDSATAAAAAPSAVATRAPATLRGIYLNAYAAGSTNRLNALLAIADSTEVNAFVIDVKDERGIRYRSENELAMSLSQEGEVTIRDLPALAAKLKEKNVWSIAR